METKNIGDKNQDGRRHSRGYFVDNINLKIRPGAWYRMRDGDVAYVMGRNPITTSLRAWIGLAIHKVKEPGGSWGELGDVCIGERAWLENGLHGGTHTRQDDLMFEIPEDEWPETHQKANADGEMEVKRWQQSI